MTTTKTLELHYIKTRRLHDPLSPSIWKNPDAPLPDRDARTLIPHDMAPLRALGMDEQADLLEGYKRFDYDAKYIPDVSIYEVHKFNFEFEYVVRDSMQPIQNKRQSGGPAYALLRTRFWRLVSGPQTDSMYYDISLTQRNNEYNYGCAILKQLNEGMSELHRGRYIADLAGNSMITRSCVLRRSPTIRDSPTNCGNPLVGDDNTEVDYDSVYEYYYGMFGSPECGKRERDDQDDIAIFLNEDPNDDPDM